MSKSRPIVLTSHSRPGSNHLSPVHWGAEDSRSRGPLIGSVSDPMHRNVIGTHSGSYSVYRAVSVAAGRLDPTHVADLTNTSPTINIGPYPQWFDPDKIVSLDPWGHIVASEFKDQIKDVLQNSELLKLDFGIFALHLCLTALFIAVPITLQQKLGLPGEEHWLVYLTVMVLSFFAMVPFIIYGEKKQQMKKTFLFAISLLMLSGLSFILTQSSFNYFWCSLFFYFMAFNLLEASLPSLVSKLAPAASKGTAMGVYSTTQFLGAFVGGVLGGWLLSLFGENGVYLLVGITCFVWLIFARMMKNPSNETGMTLRLTKLIDANKIQISHALTNIPGIEEVVLIVEDQVAYLKVKKTELDQQQLDDLMECYR